MTFERIRYILLVLGLTLLPFSTAPTDSENGFVLQIPFVGAVGIVHFGMPFLALFGLATLFYRLWRPIRLRRDMVVPLGLGVLYLLMMLVFSLFSGDLGGSVLRAVLNLIGFGVFFAVLISTSGAPGERGSQLPLRVLNLLVWSGMILSGYYLLNLALQGMNYEQVDLFGQREVGAAMGLPWGASNNIAGILNIALVGSFIQFTVEPRKTRLFMALALILPAFLFTFSRNSNFCAILFIVVYLVLVKRSAAIEVLIIAACLIIGVGLTLQNDAKEFLIDSRLRDVESIRNVQGRTEIWQDCMSYLEENPFDPVGYYGSLSAFGNSPHNWFLCTYLEMGPLGLGIGLAFWILAVARCLSSRVADTRHVRRVRLGYLIGTGAMFANLQIEDLQYTSPYIILFWCYFGTLFSLPLSLRLHPGDLSRKLVEGTKSSSFQETATLGQPV